MLAATSTRAATAAGGRRAGWVASWLHLPHEASIHQACGVRDARQPMLVHGLRQLLRGAHQAWGCAVGRARLPVALGSTMPLSAADMSALATPGRYCHAPGASSRCSAR